MRRIHLLLLSPICLGSPLLAQSLISESLTTARSDGGSYISWKEHIIDDRVLSGVPFSGSDGLEMADLELMILYPSTSQIQHTIPLLQEKHHPLWAM
jgi:hypothetical protein